jgi:DNA-binding NarL/FixJ family response regulator
MDLLILDVNIPGGGSISMIGRIRDRQPDLPILISSGISERHNAIKFLKAGVNGFISKLDTEAEYHYAINTVLSGRKYLSNSLLDYIINNLNVGLKEPMQKREHLTPMENDVLDLMLLGKQNKDISNILRLKISTVSAHRKRVLQKMDVKNLIDLVEYSNADFDLLGKR